MVHFGFSYVGLAFIAMLLIPNFIWARNKPADYDRYVGNENRVLLVLERIGEACNMVLALVFADFNIRPFTLYIRYKGLVTPGCSFNAIMHLL